MSDQQPKNYGDVNQSLNQESSIPSTTRVIFNTLVMTICGFCFGIFMQKGQMFAPKVIQGQFALTNFTMLKMFLAAFASSMISQSIYSMIDNKGFEASRACYTKFRGFNKVLPGAILLGAGMCVAGSCPGNTFVQLGSFVENSQYTFLGSTFAGLIYFFYEIFDSKQKIDYVEEDTDSALSNNIDLILNKKYYQIALPLALMCIGIIALLEYLWPWKQELGILYKSTDNIFTMYSWPPYVAGALVGMLQVPVRWVSADGLGSSTATMNVIGTIFHLIPNKHTMLKNNNHLQFFYIFIGTILGSYFSSSLSGEFNNPAVIIPLNFLPCLIGGFIMMLGARYAGGCTSGHGISGGSELGLESFAAIAAMFASGIITALVMGY